MAEVGQLDSTRRSAKMRRKDRQDTLDALGVGGSEVESRYVLYRPGRP